MKTYTFNVNNPARTITVTADTFTEARAKLKVQLSS
jgi:hypothetical protein